MPAVWDGPEPLLPARLLGSHPDGGGVGGGHAVGLHPDLGDPGPVFLDVGGDGGCERRRLVVPGLADEDDDVAACSSLFRWRGTRGLAAMLRSLGASGRL